ncbi:alpha/beta hydrolase family protein, partial [Pseudomonas sp. RIT-PI-AD]|uniref:alpha/beta hydrolase family protein n=1 Tax=Pseudomonas sp. RIT-PI-AD TaxID=3035294 RepID=UPI0021D80DD1
MPRPRRSTLQTFTLGLSLLLALRGGYAEETPADAATPPADAAPAVRAPLEERSSEETVGLERQLPLAEQQTLKAGADEFLALWKAANVGEPHGVVILVPGEGESADWPSVVGPLRGKLPDAG